MTMNVVVPLGEIRFNFIDNREDSETFGNEFIINLSDKVNTRITIPSNLWFAFKGLRDQNMLANIASIKHDPNEVISKKLNSVAFK